MVRVRASDVWMCTVNSLDYLRKITRRCVRSRDSHPPNWACSIFSIFSLYGPISWLFPCYYLQDPTAASRLPIISMFCTQRLARFRPSGAQRIFLPRNGCPERLSPSPRKSARRQPPKVQRNAARHARATARGTALGAVICFC